jgi:acetyltransferase-like isoleucine patch superfamily enzyme
MPAAAATKSERSMEQIKRDKISVITVVFNDAGHIRRTIDSFFAQTWENKEYIVVDGGSTDGTADIVKEYADRLAYWCSEKDDGMYDAMNKGIGKVTGDWICILNSGDTFAGSRSLQQAMEAAGTEGADVIYGNSIEMGEDHDVRIEASGNVAGMEYSPIYRHGSSLVRTAVQKDFLYDVSRKHELDYALDWEMIHRMYRAGRTFRKVDVDIEAYRKDGASNHPLRSLRLICRVASEGRFAPSKVAFFIKKALLLGLLQTGLYNWLRAFLMEYTVNDILPHIPFWAWRRMTLKMLRMKIGYKSFIMKKNYFMSPNHLTIGNYSHINRGCTIDARGGITIGDNVSISHNVCLMTGGHDMNTPNFKGLYLPITIADYAWLGVGCTILNNVRIGRGAVVCAGAVVTKDVDDYAVVGGVPAKKIKDRNPNLNYHCIWDSPFT